jgi:hypothetical protein
VKADIAFVLFKEKNSSVAQNRLSERARIRRYTLHETTASAHLDRFSGFFVGMNLAIAVHPGAVGACPIIVSVAMNDVPRSCR